MTDKKISIITPVFDGEMYIEKCILNVIDQNDPDTEHIIIDGGSTDKTVQIIKVFAERYPHIRWISEKDHGQSDAMNKGLAIANGTIVSFLNVDDYYELGTLTRVKEVFKTLKEPGLLVGNCKVWNEKNQLLMINKPRHLKFQDLLLGTEIFMHPINPSAYFYHKSLHDRIGLFDITDNLSMDLDFILRAVQIANIRYIDEIFGNYRLIPGTKTYEDRKNCGPSRASYLHKKYAAQLSQSDKFLLPFRKVFHYPKYLAMRIIRPVNRRIQRFVKNDE
jgi:glycosyltransferase involved in cell wall biosynthesis